MLCFTQVHPGGENKLYPETCFAYLPTPYINVIVARGNEFTISATSSYMIKNSRHEAFFAQPVRVHSSPEGIIIDSSVWGKEVWVEPSAGFLCKINGRRHRGILLITQTHKSNLEIVNKISVEEYLYGLIKSEVYPNWPLATLCAQAIAARTYALRKIWTENYTITNLPQDQVYAGVEGEDPRGRIAVDLTKGEILMYRGQPVNAVYHASSGGYLASSLEVWGEDFPYLQAKKDPLSTDSPYQHWTLRLPRNDLRKTLQQAGFDIGSIANLKLIEKDSTGRVEIILISSEKGPSYISGKRLREIVGFNLLRSTLFDIENTKDEFIFRGNGWGHGVGMSQWGAAAMGKMDYNVEDILQFYYPGTDIYKAY